MFLGYRSCRSGNRIRDSNYDTARSNMKPVGRVKYWTGLCRLLYNLVTDHSINLTRLQFQPSYWLFLFQPGDNERRDKDIVFSFLEFATFNPYDSLRPPILFALNRHPRKFHDLQQIRKIVSALFNDKRNGDCYQRLDVQFRT